MDPSRQERVPLSPARSVGAPVDLRPCARREGFEPPTARSVGWWSTSTQYGSVLLVQLRSGAESSETARVLPGNGWWTDTGTDMPTRLRYQGVLRTDCRRGGVVGGGRRR